MPACRACLICLDIKMDTSCLKSSPGNEGRRSRLSRQWEGTLASRFRCRVRCGGGGRRLGGLRAGNAPDGEPLDDAVPDRGWRARPQSVDPHSPGLRQAGAQPERQLGLRDGARAAPQRPAPQLAARQGARRLGLDQRPRVPARRAERLRRLGGTRRQGLGLQGRAALLQAHGAQRARRRCLSRAGRTHDHLRHQEALRQRQGVRGGVHAAPVPAQPRLQRRAHRRGRHGAAQRAQRLALLDGGGLPQAQSQAHEPEADDAHAGAPHPVRGQASDRRRGRGRRHRQAHRRAARGDRIGRLDQLSGPAA